jgi:hypothetical protein
MASIKRSQNKKYQIGKKISKSLSMSKAGIKLPRKKEVKDK